MYRTSYLPTPDAVTSATFGDHTAVQPVDEDPAVGFTNSTRTPQNKQMNKTIENRNNLKSTHIEFTVHNNTSPTI